MENAASSASVEFDRKTNQLICQGEWTLDNIALLTRQFKKISFPKSNHIIVNGKSIHRLDSAGAWLLLKCLKKIKKNIQWQSFSKQHLEILVLVAKKIIPPKKIPFSRSFTWLEYLGKISIFQIKELYTYLCFVGKLTFESLRVLRTPILWRWRDIISIINKTGSHALPIIALLSFMIGIVISYQMGNQLREYGADVFIVNLLGLSVLREFGPLLTAIMVAGRTGSSFTAQLGIMKINQEIDAIDTLGVTPADLLILPRIIALLIVMPLLTMWADIFGILGGMVMANSMLNISWPDFLVRFEQVIPLKTLLIGLGKAPIFALIIASIGCFEGMQVRGSAENVGVRTTQSVVLAIFFIIITDAIFSVIFSKLKL